jgi:putative lipoprotein
MALPPNAVFEAILEDVSKADAPAEVIARARIEHPGNPPIPFEITYEPSRISPSHRYAVRARIVVDDKLLFATDQHYPVLTEGQSNELALLLRRVGASTPEGESAKTSASQPATSGGNGTASLENTYWKVTRLDECARYCDFRATGTSLDPQLGVSERKWFGRLQPADGQLRTRE